MSYVEDAFDEICKEAKVVVGKYVSLYNSVPFYGGPEEGGWWGRDVYLVKSQYFPTEEAAEFAYNNVLELSKKLNEEAKINFGRQCLRESEWLEARGLDDDALPEINGEESYFVAIESSSGESCSNGVRHYE